ncbi:MAG TPA: UTP--glucose-1-phosphate uridylyltransferase [bacterium]|nr:UTP--glucose-1-phosphate uridylyltransferase [bacterium]
MKTKTTITKAVIPAAGYGTRFLPATKASPKEMMPIVDKPIIQYVVEDAVSAGITDIVIITGWQKRSIEDHFDYPFELEKKLENSGKLAELDEIRQIADLANFYYIRQKGPQGNATPIWNARHIIGNEPFLVLWGDDFIKASPTRSQQLVKAYKEHPGSAILGSLRMNQPADYERYGYAKGQEIKNGLLQIEQVIEKPGIGKIDSDYALISGYLFEPEIFNAIEQAMFNLEKEGVERELHYIDALNILLAQQKTCYALEIQNGRYYDCGNKLEYLKTVVEFGLLHPDIGPDFQQYINNLRF